MPEDRKIEDIKSNEELLKSVEKAAARGATKGRVLSGLLSSIPTLIILAIIAILVIPKIFALNNGLKGFFRTDEPVEGHDTTLENYGILGYKAVDFEEAILGDSKKVKKLEVYEQEVSDATTTTDTGLFDLSVFTKNQVITYYGTVVYTVDLSSISRSDISFDEEQKIVTLKIPHAEQGEINIPENKIQIGDTTKGLLAFGEIKLTEEERLEVQAGAREKMQEKLNEQNVQETADKFAKLVVWETYSPIVKAIGKDVSLEVIHG